eukprot:CAMPEP_0119324740 /NCGR_PEP_ID=MMETSP1333-20130426/64049_1 /TAXON_ID=418940 /ORGANISM="Scyphosphaera apsteinii, Strain RCC1455" /LENGTH=338 /DNA_ID=CAMNT_0007332523 /DNA_START=82 /DNA_END=1098 /DNA_ORIENTATION=-
MGDEHMPRVQTRALDFFIFGHPCSMSPSPEIHNVGFAENGHAHRYDRYDHEDCKEVMAKIRLPSTGGGSVTIPHKESVLAEMDVLSDAAKRIGAVNTVTKQPDGRLHGDNTDWLGIKRQIEARLGSAVFASASELVGLICGAGGTAKAAAYAFERMSVSHVIIMNRTVARAQALAAEYGAGFVALAPDDTAAALTKFGRLDFIVSTLPGSTEFVLPDAVCALATKHRPVVVEASYIPRQTAFAKQMLDAGCDVIEGIEMLFEQGCAQCEIWTGAPAPRSQIAANLLATLFTPGSGHPASTKMEPLNAPPLTLRLEAAGKAQGTCVDVEQLANKKAKVM